MKAIASSTNWRLHRCRRTFRPWFASRLRRSGLPSLVEKPDRWRNVADLPLRHANNPDHYLDLEQLDWAGLDWASLSPLRYEFARQFAAGREAHAGEFPRIDPAKNAEHVREWPGFLPWTITESFARLKSAFSCLRAYQEGGGRPAEIANAAGQRHLFHGCHGALCGRWRAAPASDGTSQRVGGRQSARLHHRPEIPFLDRRRIHRPRRHHLHPARSAARPARLLATNPPAGTRDAMFTR